MSKFLHRTWFRFVLYFSDSQREREWQETRRKNTGTHPSKSNCLVWFGFWFGLFWFDDIFLAVPQKSDSWEYAGWPINPNPIACVRKLHRAQLHFGRKWIRRRVSTSSICRTVHFLFCSILQASGFFHREISNCEIFSTTKTVLIRLAIQCAGCQIPYQEWARQWWLGRVQYLVLSSLADWVLSMDGQQPSSVWSSPTPWLSEWQGHLYT